MDSPPPPSSSDLLPLGGPMDGQVSPGEREGPSREGGVRPTIVGLYLWPVGADTALVLSIRPHWTNTAEKCTQYPLDCDLQVAPVVAGFWYWLGDHRLYSTLQGGFVGLLIGGPKCRISNPRNGKYKSRLSLSLIFRNVNFEFKKRLGPNLQCYYIVSPMSHLEFKKFPCRLVGFMSQGSF